METIMPHHQNLMRALRKEMGWPLFTPMNDAIAFSSGRATNVEIGMELGRIAQSMRRDLIYSGWANTRAKDPTSICVAYRELLSIDIVDRLVPWAANDDAPVVLVSTRGTDETFAIDRRGSLVRMPGRPANIGKGRKLAMKRIKAAASTMSDELLANNRFVEPGADWVEPGATAGVIVRFG